MPCYQAHQLGDRRTNDAYTFFVVWIDWVDGSIACLSDGVSNGNMFIGQEPDTTTEPWFHSKRLLEQTLLAFGRFDVVLERLLQSRQAFSQLRRPSGITRRGSRQLIREPQVRIGRLDADGVLSAVRRFPG